MKEEDKLVEHFGRKGPWKVPDGYFEAVRIEIMAKLPEYPAKPAAVRMSLWQRLKPYTYLAAMFAGIWCMMQVFHRASDNMGSLNIDNPPANIAALMNDPEISDIYLVGQNISDEELIDELSQSYDNMEDFEADFGYELEPEYNNIQL